MERIIIGLTGDTSKGKGSVSQILKTKGFDVFVLSDFIVEEAVKMHWPYEDRKVLQDLGDNMRSRFGNDILVKKTFQLERFKTTDHIVIDGIRHPDEITLLRDVFPEAKVIGVDMSDTRAFGLMRLRGRLGDPKTFQEYQLSKERERGEKGTNAMQVDECLKMADFMIWNEGTKFDLEFETSRYLANLHIEGWGKEHEIHGHHREHR